MFAFEPREVRLRDGRRALLRPLRPGDVGAWCEMVRACSPETIWKRFELRSAEAVIARAGELCRCDPECELIIVAELGGRIVGEARICVVPGSGAAEFCVLVADPWQGLGLGSALTDLALGLTEEAGLERVLVEVVPENVRIISFLKRRGFTFSTDGCGRTCFGELHLNRGR